MFKPNTPLHSVYTSMTCPCAQCQQERNAQTAILPRLRQPAPNEGIIAEIVTAINSETGEKVTYYWPIRRKY
jgi:hypothetical protein